MPYGPCVVCGATNYGMSMGGPSICPSCDCGPPDPRQVRLLREENMRLRAGAPISVLPDGFSATPTDGDKSRDELIASKDRQIAEMQAEIEGLRKRIVDDLDSGRRR